MIVVLILTLWYLWEERREALFLPLPTGPYSQPGAAF